MEIELTADDLANELARLQSTLHQPRLRIVRDVYDHPRTDTGWTITRLYRGSIEIQEHSDNNK